MRARLRAELARKSGYYRIQQVWSYGPIVNFFQFLTSFVGFHSINVNEVDSRRKSQADFDNSGDTQTNDNFGAAHSDNGLTVSAEKSLPSNQRTSSTQESSPERNEHKTDQPKTSGDECRKRVRTKAFENTGELRCLRAKDMQLIRT